MRAGCIYVSLDGLQHSSELATGPFRRSHDLICNVRRIGDNSRAACIAQNVSCSDLAGGAWREDRAAKGKHLFRKVLGEAHGFGHSLSPQA